MNTPQQQQENKNIVIFHHLGVYLQMLADGYNNNPYTDNSFSRPFVSTSKVKYFAKKGSKYTKIIQVEFDSKDIAFDDVKPSWARGSVHAFIDNATGDVLKASSWSKPAKGVRFNLLDDDSRKLLLEKALMSNSYLGGYLYANAK